MPITYPRTAVQMAFLRVSNIHAEAINLRALSGGTDSDDLRDRLERIRRAYLDDIEPLVQLGAAVCNADVAANSRGAPADTHAAFTTLRAALVAFFQGYKAIYDTLPKTTFSVQGGHDPSPISGASLATLVTPLDDIISAAAVFD